MNKKDALRRAREITMRACMFGERIPYGELEELAACGLKMERVAVCGFDGFAVLWKDGEWEYIAAPRRRNPGRKQTCTMFTWADVVAFENADRALCAGNYAEASRIAEGIGSATLRNAIAEGLERLEAEMAAGQIEAQFAEIAEPEPKPEPAPVDELAQVHMLLGSPDNVAVTQKRPGCCIWVSGDTKPHRETLKDFGFRWSPKRSAWYWKPQAA